MHPSFHDSIALRLDDSTRQFEAVPCQDLSWSIADAGALYGAILVERFRTYAGKLLNLTDHRTRLFYGARQFSIEMPSIALEMETNSKRLVELNSELMHQCGDVSIVLLLSPGVPTPNNALGTSPTCMMHLSQLPFPKLDDWYKRGTDLSIGFHQAVPSTCWPHQIKSRSRLPYFLSDATLATIQANSLAVLTTTRGTVSDTSVANILLVDSDGEFVSPPKEDILVGCTLQAIERLLKNNNVNIRYRNIETKELATASEVLLTGSSGGVWSARSIDGIQIGTECDRPKLQMLTQLWKEHVGIDFVAQAAQYSGL